MPRPRFSLRWLFGVVSFAAVGCALLVYATPFWSKLTFTCTLAALAAAAVAAFMRHDARRAFWAGFVLVGVAYLWLVCGTWATPCGHAPLRDWLLTTAVLDWCHDKLPHTRSIPSSPPPGMYPGMGGGSTMMGGPGYGPMTGTMPGLMPSVPPGVNFAAPPGATLTAPPDLADFSIAGHSLFALLFAMLAGLLAQLGYCATRSRRSLAGDPFEASSN